ncbi:ubiquinol-cytochrome c reductase complex assembly factor 1 isoform X2 [Nomia melanderi]|uniref:ubiquinol-cytochrome c reductase complex assembly factor 1 isoform X2 n=1 Tax=Nomia melanderi TaxID=2448451 RepID=UPI00130408A5|nr:ubiquinol-cytochrome-c reductase complex assembly factor 1 isoform X2 [Nomia melanderi]
MHKKELLSSALKYALERQCVISNNIGFSMRPQIRHMCKDFDDTRVSLHPSNIYRNSPRINKIFKLFRINKRKYQLISLGYLLYANILETVDYSTFYKDFNMPDTFFSWFLITELHVWMLMVRYISEGNEGKFVRDNMLESMWKDIDVRMTKVCPMDGRTKRKQLVKLTGQFYSALIHYDEGILSDDKVLAAALWTIFFVEECNNPEMIERLLIYVRKQMYLLDKIPEDDLMWNPYIKWMQLKSVR